MWEECESLGVSEQTYKFYLQETGKRHRRGNIGTWLKRSRRKPGRNIREHGDPTVYHEILKQKEK